MFNPFKSEEPKAGQDAAFTVTDEMLVEAEAATKEAGLEDDETVIRMFETGFVAPNGTQHNPLEFIAQRKALLEAGDVGASAPEIEDGALVQHSKAPEAERGSFSQV
jgi:hypothetical protein